jgi:hypothetical protein
MKPRLTDKVKHGLWLIVARSATVMEAEAGGLDKEEREAVLAASRYADAHWKEVQDDAGDR